MISSEDQEYSTVDKVWLQPDEIIIYECPQGAHIKYWIKILIIAEDQDDSKWLYL